MSKKAYNCTVTCSNNDLVLVVSLSKSHVEWQGFPILIATSVLKGRGLQNEIEVGHINKGLENSGCGKMDDDRKKVSC